MLIGYLKEKLPRRLPRIQRIGPDKGGRWTMAGIGMNSKHKYEEQSLVRKAVEIEMMELKAGKVKTYSFQKIKTSVSSRNEP
jgi:hypothetical protein